MSFGERSAPSTPYPRAARLAATLLVAAAGLALALASPAQTVPASAIGASGAERLGPAKRGLHFAFDASISMCGFLNASDSRRKTDS